MNSSIEKNSLSNVFNIRDFRLLWLGSATSNLGDQFSLIAMPWLVLQLTGDPLALGIVLALEGIPRAVFMLVGGAITDRLSPRLIMIISDLIRFGLTALMALLVLSGYIQLWMVYGIALAFGLVAGFAVPAANSIVPTLIPEKDLQAGNSISMGTTQLISFLGPTLAGLVIAAFTQSNTGITLAFAIDAFSFVVSAVTMLAMQNRGAQTQADETGLLESIRDSLVYLWNNHDLRFMFTIILLTNFIFTGPLLVGIPVLASEKLIEGSVAYGLLMSAYAGGTLAGFLLAGVLPRPTGKILSVIMLLLLLSFGVGMSLFSIVTTTWIDFVLMMLMGIGNGYIAILVITWFQNSTPKAMLGRMMSLVMLSSTGLLPVSQALSGLIGKWSISGLFVVAGLAGIALTLWVSTQPALRNLSRVVAKDLNQVA
ncbi:MAG: MFS transporter [Anaerolineae bacterium]|nr:MFS transporter [Anaerolineae bacterium]